MATVEAVYQAFGKDLRPVAKAAMRQFLRGNKGQSTQGGGGVSHGDIEAFTGGALTTKQVRDRCAQAADATYNFPEEWR